MRRSRGRFRTTGRSFPGCGRLQLLHHLTTLVQVCLSLRSHMHATHRSFARAAAFLGAALLGLSVALPAVAAPHGARGGKPPVQATSAADPALIRRLCALSPNVDPDEARAVARVSYETGRQLKREWRVVWPPGLHNLLVNKGQRKGGLCFQWAEELAPRLDALNLKTLTLHWAESNFGMESEHNVLVVTATGQPFRTGILLDNWRYSGHLAWGFVIHDPEYHWKENPVPLAVVRRRPNPYRRPEPERATTQEVRTTAR